MVTKWLVSGSRPDNLKRNMPGFNVLCSMLSIEIMCENKLELGHHETIAEVCVSPCTLKFEGANERS